MVGVAPIDIGPIEESILLITSFMSQLTITLNFSLVLLIFDMNLIEKPKQIHSTRLTVVHLDPTCVLLQSQAV